MWYCNETKMDSNIKTNIKTNEKNHEQVMNLHLEIKNITLLYNIRKESYIEGDYYNETFSNDFQNICICLTIAWTTKGFVANGS